MVDADSVVIMVGAAVVGAVVVLCAQFIGSLLRVRLDCCPTCGRLIRRVGPK